MAEWHMSGDGEAAPDAPPPLGAERCAFEGRLMRHSQFLLIAIGITLDAVSIAKPSDHRYSEPFVLAGALG